MKFGLYWKRYNDLQERYLGKINVFRRTLITFDYLISYLIYGASFNDYFAYKFFKLKHSAKKQFLTAKKHRKLQKICNKDKDGIEICRNKIKFNLYFSDKLGRNWLDFEKASFEEFSSFIKNSKSEIYIKDAYGLCGKGISVVSTPIKNIKELYQTLKKDNVPYLLETRINQFGALAEFHPSSINTIRITTVYDSKKDKVHIMKGNLRFGRGQKSVDNMKSGGIAAHVDLETGIVDSPGFDDYNNIYLFHPDSDKQIIGFKVPFWEECKRFIIEVAKKIPQVGYIGWDIVSSGDGNFVLIEANDNGGPNMQQYNKDGIWPEYKKILKIMK